MAIREIIKMGHPTLRKIARPFPPDQIGSTDFQALVEDMADTLKATGNGIGLAAPQIDVDYQMAIIEIENPSTRYGEIETLPLSVFVNPAITVLEPESAGYWEGCLSVPGMMGFVERPQHIRVDYLDENGQRRSLVAKGFLATVFQHEFDHLQGRLYVDHITDMTRFSYEDEYLRFHQTRED